MDEILADLTKGTDKSNISNAKIAVLQCSKDEYLATLAPENGVLKFFEMCFVHHNSEGEDKGEDTLLSASEESEGIQRLLNLIPPLEYLKSTNRVALIDKIDLGLHPLVIRKIMRYFIDQTSKRHSQLICTTNEIDLMDLKLLGRKEIWFVEKKDKVSMLYPLDQFKFGEDLNLKDNYLSGRFRAIPHL